MEQVIIEVNRYNEKIGVFPESEFYTGKKIHRSSHLLLFDSSSRVLLQKRSPDKKWYPNCYTFSVSGTVENETYRGCILREMEEEIGIKVNPDLLFVYRFLGETDKAFHAVFYAEYSGEELSLDEKEISEARWMDVVELSKDIEKNPGKYATPFIRGMKIFLTAFYDLEGKKPILL